jgi:hypothetical protein
VFLLKTGETGLEIFEEGKAPIVDKIVNKFYFSLLEITSSKP